ncbi:hypothetical protein JVT61DRAFT_5834 [Boletus reticuloceps]|uniref:Uncharacterized protein n=1 Tax=Boletus reticuloceps TaxID=495285 RepID=A0A8I2Z087_9AGAM|nr:hypothetical protein JVT61DRAFT_5834 [Boletus reticuloceps]
MRTLTARLQLAKSRGTLPAETETAVQSPLRKLKSVFPTTKLSKGNPLDVHLTAPTGDPTRQRNLVFSDLGAVESDWVAEEFVLAYFEGDGISPPVSTVPCWPKTGPLNAQVQMKKATFERLSSIGN